MHDVLYKPVCYHVVQACQCESGARQQGRVATIRLLMKSSCLAVKYCPWQGVMWGGSCLSPPVQVWTAAESESLPGGWAEDTGAAGPSRCLMPTVGLRPGVSQPGLIRNRGTAPSLHQSASARAICSGLFVRYVKKVRRGSQLSKSWPWPCILHLAAF